MSPAALASHPASIHPESNQAPASSHQSAVGPQALSCLQNLAVVAMALPHAKRLHIIHILHARTVYVGCDIVEEIGLAWSTTSKHLPIFKAAYAVGESRAEGACLARRDRSGFLSGGSSN